MSVFTVNLQRIFIICVMKQACAANRRYSMRRRKCKQNKRYRSSARITKVLPGTGRTDRQTDGRTECNAICGTLLRRRAPRNNNRQYNAEGVKSIFVYSYNYRFHFAFRHIVMMLHFIMTRKCFFFRFTF